jgi:flagellar hook-length control protein FliK
MPEGAILMLPVTPSTGVGDTPRVAGKGTESGAFRQLLQGEQATAAQVEGEGLHEGTALPSTGRQLPLPGNALPPETYEISLLDVTGLASDEAVTGAANPTDSLIDPSLLASYLSARPEGEATSQLLTGQPAQAEAMNGLVLSDATQDGAAILAAPIAIASGSSEKAQRLEVPVKAGDIPLELEGGGANHTANRNAILMRALNESLPTNVQSSEGDPLLAVSSEEAFPLPVARQDGMGLASAAIPSDSRAIPSTLSVPQPLHHQKWGETFSDRVVWMVKQDVQVAELRLNPPQLGPLDIRINLNHDQASITFSSQHAPVREAVEAALPRLREMLADAGVTLQDSNISQHSFSDQQQAQDSRGSEHDDGFSGLAGLSDEGLEHESALPSQGHHGMIDLFA